MGQVKVPNIGGGSFFDSIVSSPAILKGGTAMGVLTAQIEISKNYLVTVTSHRDDVWNHMAYEVYKIESGVLGFISREQVGTDGTPGLTIAGNQLNCSFRSPGSSIPFLCTLALIELK